MVLVNFWEIYSSDLKCQHRPLNTVPGQSSRVRNMIFRQSYEGLSVPCISLYVTTLLLTQGSM